VATGTPTRQALATPLRYRRSATRLTAGQRDLLVDGFRQVQGISDDRGYAYHAGIHGLPLPIGCDNAHGTPYFLPWHRAYLYFFERALRDRVPDAMLTWWDWRVTRARPAQIPPLFSDATMGGRPNPLASAEVSRIALEQGGNQVGARTVRRPGASRARLPTSTEVADVLKIRDFLSFSDAVEGLHDRVHMWVGGHMGQIPYAAFDPIFWAHHAMVDRVWRLWQLGHVGAQPPAAILDDALPPFRMTVRRTLDVTALGYDYAVSTASAAVAA
jgi:tyrosinase